MRRTSILVAMLISSLCIIGCNGKYENNAQVDEGKDVIKSDVALVDEHLCRENEELMFGFDVADSMKKVAICCDGEDYITYRFGTKDNLELEYPESLNDSWNQFTYSYYFRGGGPENEGLDLNYLRFHNGDYSYELYQEYSAVEDTTSIGIRITNEKTQEVTEIEGDSKSQQGSLLSFRDHTLIKTEE